MLFCPALLWAGRYVGQPDFQHYYRHLLHSLPIWVPVLALFWIAAVLRLFWPERLPGPLPRNSNHMRAALMLGRGLFWVAAIGLLGGLLAAFAGSDTENFAMDLVGILSCVCLSAGFAVQQYVQFRREPGTCTVAGPERLFLLPLLPVVLIFLAMVVIASWGKWGWTLGTGGLFVALLLVFLSQLKQERLRRREERELR